MAILKNPQTGYLEQNLSFILAASDHLNLMKSFTDKRIN